MSDLDAHRHPALAVDLVILTIEEGEVCAVVMPRDDLAKGAFALPGGFVRHGQSLDQTVERVFAEKTGLSGIAFEQLATYGDPARDPRGHVVSVVYLALVPAMRLAQASLAAGLQLAAIRVTWTGETGGPATAQAKGAVLPLAFDHAAILGDTIRRLRGKIDYSLIGFGLLPPRFTLRDVQQVHEAILGRSLHKPAFRRKLLDRGILRETGQTETGGAYRPAALFELVQTSEE
jgi:8-oxo-dGTP diphosphatase